MPDTRTTQMPVEQSVALDAEVEKLARHVELTAKGAPEHLGPLQRHLDAVALYVNPATETIEAERLSLAVLVTRAAIEQADWLLGELRDLEAGLSALDTLAREGGYQ